MNDFFKQVCISIMSLLLVAAILSPAFVKLSHALFEHEEQTCVDVGSVHIHKIEIDCDFQKHNISPQHYPDFVKVTKIVPKSVEKENFNYYFFLTKYQKLHFALRGPPVS